ncbi:MAG: hypothetical protein Q9P01_01475 [Anaerolineae bacterium]|nr:hypothetical protein [Anaerolineae bacterium]MDQ7033532.1 hypothetical protein [Anaerolineae bacterium]
MANKTRDEFVARYEIFDRHALKDQRWYYQGTVKRYNTALQQVNFIRASLALLTGVFAAAAALIQQQVFLGSGSCSSDTIDLMAVGETLPSSCDAWRGAILLCVVLSVAIPALSAFFNSLMDLYQWDRLVQVYESAVENVNVADALSPDKDQADDSYAATYVDYVEGTLQVMSDETAQWGQSIRTPRATEEFLKEARQRSQDLNADADSTRDAANNPPQSET